MKTLAIAVGFCFAWIQTLAAIVGALLWCSYRYLPISEVHPIPFIGFVAFSSALLWLVMAVRLIARGPILATMESHTDQGIMIALVPFYPERLFQDQAGMIVGKKSGPPTKTPPAPPIDNDPPSPA